MFTNATSRSPKVLLPQLCDLADTYLALEVIQDSQAKWFARQEFQIKELPLLISTFELPAPDTKSIHGAQPCTGCKLSFSELTRSRHTHALALSVDDKSLHVVGCCLVSRARTRPYTIIKDLLQLVATLELKELVSSLVQCSSDVHRYCDSDLFNWDMIEGKSLLVLQTSRSAKPAVKETYDKKRIISLEANLRSNMAVAEGLAFTFVEVTINGVSHIGAPLLFFTVLIAGKLQQWVWIKALRLHLECCDGRVYTWSGGPRAMLVQSIRRWLPVLPLSNDKFLLCNEHAVINSFTAQSLAIEGSGMAATAGNAASMPASDGSCTGGSAAAPGDTESESSALNTADARVLLAASAGIKATAVLPSPVATAISTAAATAPGPTLQQRLKRKRLPSSIPLAPKMQRRIDDAKARIEQRKHGTMSQH